MHPKITALSFIRFIYDETNKLYPDVKILDRRTNKADSLAEVTVVFTDRKTGQSIKGFYMISIERGRGLLCGYQAPLDFFDSRHTALRNILKDLKIWPGKFSNTQDKGRFHSNSTTRAPAAPTIDAKTLKVRPSTDYSMFIAVPPNWKVGGGNHVLIATSPDEHMGVFTTNDHQPGPSLTNPHYYLMNKLLPFFGCSRTAVQKSEPNHDYRRMLKAQGLNSNATNYFGETINQKGMRVKFAIMVSGTATGGYHGGWVTTLGFYATPDLFERNYNVLYSIALSISANQSLIMGRLRQNLSRLAQASRTISQTNDVVIQSLRQGTANTNRAIDKYNYYLSGEEARYSQLEDRIYVVDSHLADYASNPNYPQEMLTTVPDHKWNVLPHERE